VIFLTSLFILKLFQEFSVNIWLLTESKSAKQFELWIDRKTDHPAIGIPTFFIFIIPATIILALSLIGELSFKLTQRHKYNVGDIFELKNNNYAVITERSRNKKYAPVYLVETKHGLDELLESELDGKTKLLEL
jgi:hypothetical protein